MDVKAPTNKFKGDGTILILGLLKDDDPGDQEMKRMTNLLEKSARRAGRNIQRMDVSETLNQCRPGRAQTLYITGHSRFMEADTKIRPVPDRRLGGFELDEVVPVLFQGILGGITEIEFWCCESACKRGTANLAGDGTGTATQRFGVKQFEMLCQHFETGNWSEISTLDFVCGKLIELAQKNKEMTGRTFDTIPTAKITALNGVGYITEDDTYITTFDQGLMLPEYNKILDFEKQIREGRKGTYTEKNLQQADGRLRKHISTRSCHFIAYELNFGAFLTESAALGRFLFKQQKARKPAQPGRISGATLTHMENTLGPLLNRQ